MRIEISGNYVELSGVLRAYAESRVGVAVRRAASRLTWVGVRFIRERGPAADQRVLCQLDVWLRGSGLVTVRHIDTNPYVAVDCAAVRLEQALVRKLRESAQHADTQEARRAPSPPRRRGATPRYAVVVTPADSRNRLSLIPWLRTRYGIDQVQTISLSCPEWDALVTDDMAAPQLKRFKDRLALAQLCHPEALIVVGGGGDAEPACQQRPQSRWELERVVRHLRALRLPVELIGVCVNEHWGQDNCLIESEELQLAEHRDLRQRRSDADEELYAGLTSD